MRRVRVSTGEANGFYFAAYHEQFRARFGDDVPEKIHRDVRQELSNAAFATLSRPVRRALGDRGYTRGFGAFAPSLKAARRG